MGWFIAKTAAVLAKPAVQGALVAVGTGVSIGATVRAGQLRSQELKEAARQQKLQTNQQLIDSRRRLIASLAAQNVAAGAGGTSPEGSFANIQQVDIARQFEEAAGIQFSGSAARNSLTDRADAARERSLLSAFGTGISAAQDLSRIGVPTKKEESE